MFDQANQATTQHAFFFDENRCIDCRACSIACRDWHDIEPGPVKYLRRFTWEQGAFPEVVLHTLFAPCYHCQQPACLAACSHGAIYKEPRFGAVLVNADKCLGCRDCWQACPYGAPQFAGDEPGSVMSKCTFCIDRLDQGHLPACVNACPARALDFDALAVLQDKYGQLRSLPGMPDANATSPAVVFKPLDLKVQLVPYDADKARSLFGQRGDSLPALYTNNTAVTDIAPGLVGKGSLVLKHPNPATAQAATRSEEW
jgi:anaerobic dimethyl sulfoxide reductase subunit B (iron-sulfur subunit)